MEDDKFIDESWKESVEKEKEQGAGQGQPSPQPHSHDDLPLDDPGSMNEDIPEINFISYITSLAFQALVFIGEIPSPITEKIEKNLKQAKLIIDTLLLLKEKTANNLNTQEANTLEAYLYELQMKYVEAVEKEGGIRG